MRSTLLGLAVLWAGAAAAMAPPFGHGLLEEVLQAHVDSVGLVDYAALKADRADLDAYVDSLGRTSPENAPQRFPTPAHELAYWINAYNAFVLRGVVDAYPVGSVRDIGAPDGFFGRKAFTAGGERMTLDHIENQIIRPLYHDARIHFAINCGAVSCPPWDGMP